MLCLFSLGILLPGSSEHTCWVAATILAWVVCLNKYEYQICGIIYYWKTRVFIHVALDRKQIFAKVKALKTWLEIEANKHNSRVTSAVSVIKYG